MPEFYVQLEIGVMLVSLALCLGTVVFGRVTCRGTGQPVMGDFPSTVDYILTTAFCLIFTATMIAPLLQGNVEHSFSQVSTLSLLVGMAGQVLLYLPFLIRYVIQPAQPDKPCVSLLRRFLWVMAGVAAVALPSLLMDALGLMDAIARLTGSPEDQDVVEGLINGTWQHRLILAGAAVIMAPICEEVCFRGFLYNVLKRHAGPVLAAVTSGLFFGSIHGALPQLLPLTIFGVVQCYAYEKSRSLWLPIAIHCVFNASSVIYILCFGHDF